MDAWADNARAVEIIIYIGETEGGPRCKKLFHVAILAQHSTETKMDV